MNQENLEKKVQRKRKHYTIKTSYEQMIKNVESECKKITEQIAYLIRQERLHNNISLRDVSRLTKVSIKTIKDLEECESLPKIETILKLAYVLDVDINLNFERQMGARVNDKEITPQEQSIEIISKELSKLFDKKAKEDILKYMEFINTTTGNRKENQHTAH